MSNILLLSGLDIFEGGVNDINVTFLDEVEEGFFVAFPHCFAFIFCVGGIGGGVGCGECCVCCGCGRWVWQCCVKEEENETLQVMHLSLLN
jgi:hypothetical protein